MTGIAITRRSGQRPISDAGLGVAPRPSVGAVFDTNQEPDVVAGLNSSVIVAAQQLRDRHAVLAFRSACLFADLK